MFVGRRCAVDRGEEVNARDSMCLHQVQRCLFHAQQRRGFQILRQYFADYRFTGVPCPVETVRTDDAAELKGGAFSDLCWERGIRQEFTTADSP